MGVRFECPRGHRLNVKAELAGKRAFCPECGVRLIVPLESGGTADEVEEAADTVAVAETVRAPVAHGGGVELIGGPQPERVDWYLQAEDGKQYGPASYETFRKWAIEGRITEKCWAWRTGWADWRPASEMLATVAPAPPAMKNPMNAGSVVALDDGAELELEAGGFEPATFGAATISDEMLNESISRARHAMQRRRQSSRNFTIMLAAIGFVLLLVMIVALAVG